MKMVCVVERGGLGSMMRLEDLAVATTESLVEGMNVEGELPPVVEVREDIQSPGASGSS